MIPKVKIKKWNIFECFSNTVYQYFFYGHYSINRALASGAYFRFPFLFEHLATAVLLPNNHGGKEHSKNLLSHFSPIGSKAFWCFLIPDFAPFNSWLLPKLTPFLVNRTRLYKNFLNFFKIKLPSFGVKIQIRHFYVILNGCKTKEKISVGAWIFDGWFY